MSLRDDIICEKMRSPKEIRKELADLIRTQGKNLAQKNLDHVDTLKKYQLNDQIWMIRKVLQWVLRHDESPQEYYRRVYGREWPEA